MNKLPDWLYIDGNTGEMYCERCHARERIPLPIPLDAFGKWAEYFAEKHKNCRKAGIKEGIRRDSQIMNRRS